MRFVFIILLLVSSMSYGQRADFSNIDFKKADSIAFVHKSASLKNLPILVHNLTTDLSSDVEKFRVIYTWVGTNIENDYSAYLRTRKKRKKLANNREALIEWNNSFTPKVLRTLVNERKTACTGYAYLIRELASLAGLNCKIIDGYGRTATLSLDKKSLPNHSWNAIELNGNWYLCDPTWSAGRIVLEEDGPKFESEYHDGYFLANPAIFVKNHYPLEVNWTLLSQPPTFEQFVEGPIVYKEAFPLNIIPIEPSKMHIQTRKNESVSFAFEVPKTFKSDSISLVVNSGGANKSVRPEVELDQNVCRLKHSFDRLGTYDVHIQVEDAIVATYVVKVKKK